MLLLAISGSVTDLGVGVRSAAAAPFRLLQVLEVDRGEGRRQTRRIRRSKFDEAKLQRLGQQAGSDFIIAFVTSVILVSVEQESLCVC